MLPHEAALRAEGHTMRVCERHTVVVSKSRPWIFGGRQRMRTYRVVRRPNTEGQRSVSACAFGRVPSACRENPIESREGVPVSAGAS